ncbi:MAG: DUF4835 family protein [Arachidicoccus sp.]|nr:DUF4835 family protein [Arachidicoccus sp.]
MRKKILLCCFLLFLFSVSMYAQELNATVIINNSQLGTSVDQSIFTTLQKQITDFLNNRKWTGDVFQSNEKILCNFTLTVTSIKSQNEYSAQLIVQAARPVYNSSYQTALVNYQDQQITFKYAPGQQLNFNPNQIAGSDPLVSNLTAVLAYYANIILGMNYDSFGMNGGKLYFAQAMNIVTAAPQNADIKGWQLFDGQRNRYWLANNLTDSKFGNIHQVFYTYFHQGLDSLYDNEIHAKNNIFDALKILQQLNDANPNSMGKQFFTENRNAEFIGIFKQAWPGIKQQALQTLVAIDPQSTDKYNTELK